MGKKLGVHTFFQRFALGHPMSISSNLIGLFYYQRARDWLKKRSRHSLPLMRNKTIIPSWLAHTRFPALFDLRSCFTDRLIWTSAHTEIGWCNYFSFHWLTPDWKCSSTISYQRNCSGTPLYAVPRLEKLLACFKGTLYQRKSCSIHFNTCIPDTNFIRFRHIEK